MALPASGQITSSMINLELGRAANAPFSLTGAEERALAGIPSGPISFQSFWGKSSYTPRYTQMISETNRFQGAYYNPDGTMTYCYDTTGNFSYLVRITPPTTPGGGTVINHILINSTGFLGGGSQFPGLRSVMFFEDKVLLAFEADRSRGVLCYLKWDLTEQPVYFKQYQGNNTGGGIRKIIPTNPGSAFVVMKTVGYNWQTLDIGTGNFTNINHYASPQRVTTDSLGTNSHIAEVLINPISGNPIIVGVAQRTSGGIVYLDLLEVSTATGNIVRQSSFEAALNSNTSYKGLGSNYFGFTATISESGQILIVGVSVDTNNQFLCTQINLSGTNAFEVVAAPTLYAINPAFFSADTPLQGMVSRAINAGANSWILVFGRANVYTNGTPPRIGRTYFVKVTFPSNYNIATIQTDAVLEVLTTTEGTPDVNFNFATVSAGIPVNSSYFGYFLNKDNYLELPYSIVGAPTKTLTYVAGGGNVSLRTLPNNNAFAPAPIQPTGPLFVPTAGRTVIFTASSTGATLSAASIILGGSGTSPVYFET